MRRRPCRQSSPLGKGLAVFLAALLASAGGVVAAGNLSIRLRNDLTPGSLSVYKVTIEGIRTSPLLRYVEKLFYRQEGLLTLLVLKPTNQTGTRRVWMMELEEAHIVSLTQDEHLIEQLPHAKMIGLPPKSVQLRTLPVTSAIASASVAGGSPVQRAGLLLALDFARWPNRIISGGEEWEGQSERPELVGKWTHKYEGVEGDRSDRLALGVFSFSGRLAGSLKQAATIKRAEGSWKWRIAKRSLESSISEIVLEYGDYERKRELSLHIELGIERRDHVSGKELPRYVEEMNQLAEMAVAVSDPHNGTVEKSLALFIETHPDSLWLPVARDLLQRVEFDRRSLGELGEEKIVAALTSLITRWQVAAIKSLTESLQPLRDTFRELAKSNREALHSLTRVEDANVRSMAIFCVAFGETQEDLQRVIECCGDSEATVRAWAAYGLAERREAAVPPDLLAKLLEDREEIVRIRACMAIQGCIAIDSSSRKTFFDLLLKIVSNDQSSAVRPYAAVALDGLAIVDDLSALIETEHRQDVPPARRLLEATIRRLGGKPKELDD